MLHSESTIKQHIFLAMCMVFLEHHTYCFYSSIKGLQKGVGEVSHLKLVNGSLDMKNHRGACLPPRHELRDGQIKYGRRHPLRTTYFLVI